MDQQTLESVYADLAVATTNYQQAISRRIELKDNLEILKAAKVFTGENKESNVEKREAWNREHFAVEYDLLNSAEITERQTKLAYDLAVQREDFVKQTLRLMELTKGA